jgi:putative multiple sugar transport system substrate-binding protein
MLLEPVDCDKSNVSDILLKANYYTADQLK